MWTEEKLDACLTQPSPELIRDMKELPGDIMILGAGGKMGPTLCLLAKKAAESSGKSKRVFAVSRFSDPIAAALLKKNGIEMIPCDLQDYEALGALPTVENVIYMAGKKFGTKGNEWQTWGMNAVLPAFVGAHFQKSKIVVFSSGNIYPQMPAFSGGCTEQDAPMPIGEYAMSCLARERAFEYASMRYGTKVFQYRLNYAVDLRYGILYDIAMQILNEQPISLKIPCFNIIWQGTANEIALRALLLADSPACIMNITGPETISVKKVAHKLGALLGKEPIFSGVEGDHAFLNDSSKAMQTFGYPMVSAETLLEWQAQWILDGGRGLGKPTHFEENKGNY